MHPGGRSWREGSPVSLQARQLRLQEPRAWRGRIPVRGRFQSALTGEYTLVLERNIRDARECKSALFDPWLESPSSAHHHLSTCAALQLIPSGRNRLDRTGVHRGRVSISRQHLRAHHSPISTMVLIRCVYALYVHLPVVLYHKCILFYRKLLHFFLFEMNHMRL